MENRALKVVALVLALGLALAVGAVAGGGLVYALTRIDGGLPVAQAQGSDPGYGIVIASVVPEGAAAEAGVVRGDILLEVNGEELDDAGDLIGLLGDLEAGDEVELTVLHGDELRTLTAGLGEQDGRAYLGVVPCGGVTVDVDTQLHLEAAGAIVVEVMPGSPAEGAGLQEGDIITAVDGEELSAETSLADLIAAYEPGDSVVLQVERPGEDALEITVQLGENPDEEGVAYLGVRYAATPNLDAFREGLFLFPGDEGFDFDFDFDLPPNLPEGEIIQGTRVRSVVEDSPASVAGLQEGDVITAVDGEPIKSPAQLSSDIGDRAPGEEVTLSVYRPDGAEQLEIDVTLGKHPDDEAKGYLGVEVAGYFRLQGLGEDVPPLDFHFEMPFDPGELPHRLPFHWPPGGDDCDGGAGCTDDSA